MEKEEQQVVEEQTEQKSKYADYVHKDGRTWEELTPEERKKVRKKLNKKKKKQEKQKLKKEGLKKHVEKIKGKSNFEQELQWCVDQIKLGLTHNEVTPDQCKFNFYYF